MGTVGTPTRVITVEREPKLLQGYRVRSLSLQWFRYTRAVSLPGSVIPNLRARWRGNSVHITGTIRSTLPYDLRGVQLMVGENAVPLGDLPAGGTLRVDRTVWLGAVAPRPTRRIMVFPHGSHTPTEYAPLSLQSVVQQWNRRWGTKPPSILLMAQAKQPVLAPELSDAFRSEAETTYLITVPLRGAP
jgi:hypothetical protein